MLARLVDGKPVANTVNSLLRQENSHRLQGAVAMEPQPVRGLERPRGIKKDRPEGRSWLQSREVGTFV